MSSSQRYGKQGPYSSIEPISEERDSGHESDSTACSDAFLARKGALGSTEGKLICRSKKSQLALNWFRWGTLVALQLLIVILLSSILPNSAVNRDSGGIANVETGGDVNGIFTSVAHTIMPWVADEATYMPNMTNADEEHRKTVRSNWDKLLPKGSGNLIIPNHKSYPLLGAPIHDDKHHPNVEGLYQTTWTHALHCLYHSVDLYHSLNLHLNNHNLTKNTDWIDQHHATHCLEYLRHYILCSADMTLEGGSSKVGHEGLMQEHVCRDRSEVVRWSEERRVDDRQTIHGA